MLLLTFFPKSITRSHLPNPIEQVCPVLEVPGFRVDTEATHERQGDGALPRWPVVSFGLESREYVDHSVHWKEEKERTACSKTILPGSTEGAAELVEVLLNVAYEGAVFDTTCRWPGAEMNLEYTRYQAKKR